LQLSVEQAMRGRVMSLYMMVFLGSTPLGSPLVGWIAQEWGPRWSIGVGAIAALVVGLVASIWAKARWKVVVRVDHLIPPHILIANPEAGETDPNPDPSS
jgi:MFS family permease